MCDDPGFIENGQRDRNGPFVCGLIVPFTCDAGFSLMGAPYISCQTTGKWDRPVPRCVSTGNPYYRPKRSFGQGNIFTPAWVSEIFGGYDIFGG